MNLRTIRMKSDISRIIIAMILIMICSISSCKNIPNKSNFNFDTQAASVDKGNGWVYYFYYDKTKGKGFDENGSCRFGGYNLKYKRMDGYFIPIKDSKTGETIGTATASLPALIHNPSTKPEVDRINEYLNSKKTVDRIDTSDLEELHLETISKTDIVNLYNEAMAKDFLPEGKYYYLPEANIVQDIELDGYQWQVGYYTAHGVILAINIELIYNQTIYLSDRVDTNSADTEQQKIYQIMNETERAILNSQKLTPEDLGDYLEGNVSFKRLRHLLEYIDQGGK